MSEKTNRVTINGCIVYEDLTGQGQLLCEGICDKLGQETIDVLKQGLSVGFTCENLQECKAKVLPTNDCL